MKRARSRWAVLLGDVRRILVRQPVGQVLDPQDGVESLRIEIDHVMLVPRVCEPARKVIEHRSAE
jgi:hypothetical protein